MSQAQWCPEIESPHPTTSIALFSPRPLASREASVNRALAQPPKITSFKPTDSPVRTTQRCMRISFARTAADLYRIASRSTKQCAFSLEGHVAFCCPEARLRAAARHFRPKPHQRSGTSIGLEDWLLQREETRSHCAQIHPGVRER